MLGQEVPIGTGAIDVLFDEEMFFDNVISYRKEEEKGEVVDEHAEFKAAYCDNLF